MTSRPLDWIPEIQASLVALDEKPQFILPKPLDWDVLENELQQLFELPDLKLSHVSKGWVASSSLAPLTDHHLVLSIEWQPIEPPAYFVMNEEDIKDFISLLFQTADSGSYFYDSAYAEALIHYMTAEVLRLLHKQEFADPLTARLGSSASALDTLNTEESFFQLDIDVEIKNRHFWGTVLLSPSFRTAWKGYFSKFAQTPQGKLKDKLKVNVAIEVGHSHLKLQEWKSVKVGDLIVLDHCSYDPVEHKGAVVLTLGGKPVMRGRLKEGGIKLTGYPIYEEASETMDDEDHFEDEDEELYSDFDTDEDDEDDENLESDSEEDEDEESSEQEESSHQEESAEQQKPQVENLPIYLTVEIARVKMTAGELYELAPGNLLDLNVSADQGVDLVINGKKVGRGELIRMGDVLGVRVLSL